jgi:hypothetical protein
MIAAVHINTPKESTMNIRINIERIDNGLIVSSGVAPSDSDPLAQRGPSASRCYVADAVAAGAHVTDIIRLCNPDKPR